MDGFITSPRRALCASAGRPSIQKGTIVVDAAGAMSVGTVMMSSDQASMPSTTVSARSAMSKPSRSSASVIDSGGFVKKVFQRTNV